MIDNGLFVPILSVYRDKISDLNPLLAQKLYPINTAHYLALIKVGYYLKDSSNYCWSGIRIISKIDNYFSVIYAIMLYSLNILFWE